MQETADTNRTGAIGGLYLQSLASRSVGALRTLTNRMATSFVLRCFVSSC